MEAATIADLALSIGLTLLAGLASWQTRRVRGLGRELRAAAQARGALEQEMHALLEVSRTLGARIRDQHSQQLALSAQLQILTRQLAGHEAPQAYPRTSSSPPPAADLPAEPAQPLGELSQGEAALLSRWRARRAAA